MNRLLIVACVLGSGCHWIAAVLEPAPKVKPLVLPETARAEWVEGSFQIVPDSDGRGARFSAEFWQSDDLNEVTEAGAVSYKLSGPGVDHLFVRPPTATNWSVSWDGDWKAGTYTVSMIALGKVVAERSFVVAWLPTTFGSTYPTVVPDGPHVVARRDWPLVTYLPMNVATPRYSAQKVWIRDHQVVGSRDKVVGFESLFSMQRLGGYEKLELDTKDAGEAASLYVFIGGKGLFGAWAWTKVQADPVISLPAITPDAKDLALARAAAKKIASEAEANLLDGPHDEPLACAVATSEAARKAYEDYKRQVWEGAMSGSRESDDLNRANNDASLTDKQRAHLRKDAATQAQYGELAAMHGLTGIDAATAIARKYKKGCLAKLGVPSLPPLH